jgi:hypothetical protein
VETLLIILAILFILPILAGWFFRRKIVVVESKTINSPPDVLYKKVQDLTSWQEWSAWSTHNDPALAVNFGDRQQGRGAVLEWKGSKMGKGKLEITGAKPNKELVIDSGFHTNRFKVQHQLLFSPNDTGCHLIWKATVTTKYSSVARLLGRLFMRNLRRDIQIGLQLLAQIA